VVPGEQSAEAIVVEANEPESAKLGKIAGGSHFDEGPRRRRGIGRLVGGRVRT